MKYLRKFETQNEYNTFISNTKDYPNVCLVAEDGRIAYNPPPPSPLYIEAIEDLTIKFSGSYQYSKDNTTWNSGTYFTSISARAGEKVYFRASGLNALNDNGIGMFTITGGVCNVGGSIMSMEYGDDYIGKAELTKIYQFKRMFKGATQIVGASKLLLPATTLSGQCYTEMFSGCTSLVNAPTLPATAVASDSYQSMFSGCTSLVNAPALPATALMDQCYQHMFKGCTSLVNAPALPATTLSYRCYQSMFSGCTSLVNAPALPATALMDQCYQYMFKGCTSLVNAPALPATALMDKCYVSMFYGCTSLVNTPELPATTLSSHCYKEMFYGCTSLVNAPELPATTLASFCYSSMFKDCTSLVNAPTLPAGVLQTYCYTEMFSGCTSLVNAPTLPATALVLQCYTSLFYGCTKLNYIKAMFTTNPSNNTYTTNWVSGVSPSGTFVKNSAAKWDKTGVDGIPEGWTVTTASA